MLVILFAKERIYYNSITKLHFTEGQNVMTSLTFVARDSIMLRYLSFAFVCVLTSTSFAMAQRQMENLTRGTLAVRSADGVYVGWRLLGTDPEGIEFNVYRQDSDGNETKITDEPLSGATNLVDRNAPAEGDISYRVVPVIDGKELKSTAAVNVWEQNYLEFPIQPIDGYSPGDASVADLDGDGQLDIVLHQASHGATTAQQV